MIIGDNIDSDRLLRAIKRQETSNCDGGGVRFEPSWMPKGVRMAVQGRIIVGAGKNYDRSTVAQSRWQHYGVWSCASYGPWQLLFHTIADLGYADHPCHLNDGAISLWWATKLLQRIADKGAHSVRDFADAWNTGNCADLIHNKEYEDNIIRYYEEDKG
jgi:hypothetical protein